MMGSYDTSYMKWNTAFHFKFQHTISKYLIELSQQNTKTYLEADTDHVYLSSMFFLANILLSEIRLYNKTNQGTHTYPLDSDLHRFKLESTIKKTKKW